MGTETNVLTAHVPLSLAEKVEAMASRLERSRGWVMKQANVDAGRVIDHQSIQSWADSLSTDKPLPPPAK